jgi:hypothetical protein
MRLRLRRHRLFLPYMFVYRFGDNEILKQFYTICTSMLFKKIGAGIPQEVLQPKPELHKLCNSAFVIGDLFRLCYNAYNAMKNQRIIQSMSTDFSLEFRSHARML